MALSPTHSILDSSCTSKAATSWFKMVCMQVSMDEIDLAEQIGKGGFGAVYKGTWRGAPVAVKYAVCNVQDADSIEGAIREVVLSKKMSHPHVVSTTSCIAPWIGHARYIQQYDSDIPFDPSGVSDVA